jgi:hypothetical protein
MRRAGLAPYRCHECSARFIRQSTSKRSLSESLAQYLGATDPKQQRKLTERVVMIVLGLVLAVGYLFLR